MNRLQAVRVAVLLWLIRRKQRQLNRLTEKLNRLRITNQDRRAWQMNNEKKPDYERCKPCEGTGFVVIKNHGEPARHQVCAICKGSGFDLKGRP